MDPGPGVMRALAGMATGPGTVATPVAVRAAGPGCEVAPGSGLDAEFEAGLETGREMRARTGPGPGLAAAPEAGFEAAPERGFGSGSGVRHGLECGPACGSGGRSGVTGGASGEQSPAAVLPRSRPWSRSPGPCAARPARAAVRAVALLSVKALALLASGWLIAAPAGAAVYRCERPGGVVYTDTPCTAGSTALDLRAPVAIDGGPAADLAGAHDARRKRELDARDRGTQVFLEQHAQRKADEQRRRQALVEGRVVRGMSMADVRQVWGEPDRVDRDVGVSGERERWSWQGARERRSVTFESGRVASDSSRSAAAGRRARPERPAASPGD